MIERKKHIFQVLGLRKLVVIDNPNICKVFVISRIQIVELRA